jgi:hypothetical protein
MCSRCRVNGWSQLKIIKISLQSSVPCAQFVVYSMLSYCDCRYTAAVCEVAYGHVPAFLCKSMLLLT